MSQKSLTVDVTHTGSNGGTSYFLNHYFGHTNYGPIVRFDSEVVGVVRMIDYTYSSGNFGFEMRYIGTETCEIVIYQFATGGATSTLDVTMRLVEQN